jgi:hypothetical protein
MMVLTKPISKDAFSLVPPSSSMMMSAMSPSFFSMKAIAFSSVSRRSNGLISAHAFCAAAAER